MKPPRDGGHGAQHRRDAVGRDQPQPLDAPVRSRIGPFQPGGAVGKDGPGIDTAPKRKRPACHVGYKARSTARAARSAISSRYSADVICTARGSPAPFTPTGMEIAGWRVRLNRKVQGAQSFHSA